MCEIEVKFNVYSKEEILFVILEELYKERGG